MGRSHGGRVTGRNRRESRASQAPDWGWGNANDGESPDGSQKEGKTGGQSSDLAHGYSNPGGPIRGGRRMMPAPVALCQRDNTEAFRAALTFAARPLALRCQALTDLDFAAVGRSSGLAPLSRLISPQF